jgi:hypothetical protein
MALLAFGTVANPSLAVADDASREGAGGNVDYLEPKDLTGTIYPDSDSRNVLFTFRRTASESNSTIRVLREYKLPNGSPASREQLVYETGQLVFYELNDFRSGSHATVKIEPDSKPSSGREITFAFSQGSTKKNGHEELAPDTLINDMMAPFIITHWEELMNGATVKLRLIAATRAETVGFKLVKETETTLRGKPIVVIRLEAGSPIVGQFFRPVRFTVEKNGSHRILQYSGRTTPTVRRNGKWENLDALTVFDWK